MRSHSTSMVAEESSCSEQSAGRMGLVVLFVSFVVLSVSFVV